MAVLSVISAQKSLSYSSIYSSIFFSKISLRSVMAKAFSILFFSLLVFSLVDNSFACRRSLKEGKVAKVYEIKKGDFSVKVSNYGATILSVVLPDSHGKLGDIVLGYEGFGPYLILIKRGLALEQEAAMKLYQNPDGVKNDTTYFGALVGRVANRIAGARFVLNGVPYTLYRNDGNNSLHGGHRGFSDVFWTVKEITNEDSPYIKLYYRSFDGEQGFPGDLDVYVTYKISSDYTLSVSMEARALNKATPVNLAQHSYWNLGGEGSGTILSHTVQIFASKITPVNNNLIPTGKFLDIKNTPYNFLEPEEVGSRINKIKGGYDINYVLESNFEDGMRKVAVVEDCQGSERTMELWTNQPGVQFYTGNFLKDVKGKNGHVYPQYGGLCLETQGFPNSVNQHNFPSQIVQPGEFYRHEMLYKFSF